MASTIASTAAARFTNTDTVRSDRFDAVIEYSLDDLDVDGLELVTVWGIAEDGRCFFIYFLDGVFDDTLTEEA